MQLMKTMSPPTMKMITLHNIPYNVKIIFGLKIHYENIRECVITHVN